MTKEQADKIAQKIANDWKLFWMSQTQNSKQDYDNYFRRALAVDANMRVHLESLISAALVDASKVTECAEFEEAWNKSSDAKNENSMLKRFANHWFSIGQKSKALKLPDKDEIHNLASNAQNNATDNTYNNAVDVIEACIDLIEKLNEGK